MTHQRVICGVFAAGLLAGCRPSLPAHKEVVPVTGKIVRANGEPVRRVLIDMQPKDPEIGVHCRGATDAEGSLHLSTYSNEEDDGAVPAEYSLKLTPIDGQSTQIRIADMPLTIEDGANEDIEIRLKE
jgi:hypothetical protein